MASRAVLRQEQHIALLGRDRVLDRALSLEGGDQIVQHEGGLASTAGIGQEQARAQSFVLRPRPHELGCHLSGERGALEDRGHGFSLIYSLDIIIPHI